jgi:hypothetical protein
MISFADFAKHLQASIRECHPRLEIGLAKVGELTQTMAVEYIGHEMPQWPALADRTIAEKTKLGYVGHVSPTDPLLRTGEMRDSIHIAVERLSLTVGSNSEVARWQELGTSRIPPRPFIATAAMASLPYAHDVFGKIAISLLVPGKRA